MCSLTTEASRVVARAKPHPRCRSWVSAVLACGIAACDAQPLVATDANDGFDVSRGADTGPLEADATAAFDALVATDAGPIADAGRSDSWVVGDYDVLFVGNSYVYTGDVPGRVRLLAAPSTTRIESIVFGGYRLSQHAMDAETDGTTLAPFLRTGTVAERAFDAVILQEQSQIGGFPESDPTRMESLDGASLLAALARANGSGVVLYLTWGRELGDETNPGLFPTFEAMQDRLDAGYRTMAMRLRDEGTRVRIAPVGAAFRVIHDDVVADGMDPTAEGSPFDALYSPDGSHPSANGAYLIALVIHATITDLDPTTFADASDLDAPTSSALRDAAARVMRDPTWAEER